MNVHKPRVIKLAVLIVFCILAPAYLGSRRTTYAVSLPQSIHSKNPLQPTEKNIALGLDHFDAHCAGCHGSTGRADIEKGKAVKAADLTSDKVQSKSDAELFRTISKGVPGTAVPANARHKHGAGKAEEHHHPEAEAPAQPEPGAHDMSKMGEEKAGTGDA